MVTKDISFGSVVDSTISVQRATKTRRSVRLSISCSCRCRSASSTVLGGQVRADSVDDE